MAFILQCPYCPAKIKLPNSAVNATCPKCMKTFSTTEAREASAREDAAITAEKKVPAARSSTGIKKPESSPTVPSKRRSAPVPSDDDDEDVESSVPGWISPWGATGFVLAAVGLVSASVIGVWILSLVLTCLGFLAVLVGLVVTRKEPQGKDYIWHALGAILSLGILAVLFLAPGLLQNRWAMDFTVARGDQNKQVRIPRDVPRDPGKPMAADESVDAASEAIRQGDVVMRVESVKVDPLPAKGATSYLLVHLRLSNVNSSLGIPFAGFSNDKHKPVLTDDKGKSYAFVEPWRRKEGVKGIVFEEGGKREGTIIASSRLDHLLVFQAPPEGVDSFQLTVPASAWGAKGVGKFRIANFFP